MGVVNDAIQYGIGIGRVTDQLMPFVHRDLAGDDGGAPAIAFFEDFEKIMTGGGIEWLKTPIVQDEQLHAAECPQDASITTIAAGEREVGEELGRALIEDGAIVATGFVAES